jgi:hypothetical protein
MYILIYAWLGLGMYLISNPFLAENYKINRAIVWPIFVVIFVIKFLVDRVMFTYADIHVMQRSFNAKLIEDKSN